MRLNISFRIGLFILLSALFTDNNLEAQSNYDSLVVLHLADIHVADYTGYHPGLRSKRREQYNDNFSAFEKFLQTVPKQTHADEIITSGDNVDFYEADKPDGDEKAGQIENFLKLCKKSPVPIYLTIGNHETSTFYSKETKEKLNKKSGHFKAAEAKANWIRNAKCFENGIYYSQKFTVGGTPYLFLFLDVAYRVPGEPTDAYWNPEMLEWINYQLDQNPDSKAVMFFHIPIPVPDNNNDGKFIMKPIDGWPNKDTYKSGIMKTLNEHSNVKVLFVGHVHENIMEEMIFPSGKRIPEIETASFGESQNNWRILTFKKDMIKVSKPGASEVEYNISVK